VSWPPSVHLAVHVFPVSHFNYQHEEDFVPDLIDNAVVLPWSDLDAIELFLGLHLLEPVRARILFQAENIPVHLLADAGIELANVPLGGGSDFNAVRQP
jgi:hypothetical protein